MARRSLCKARYPLKINSELLWSRPTGTTKAVADAITVKIVNR